MKRLAPLLSMKPETPKGAESQQSVESAKLQTIAKIVKGREAKSSKT